MKHSSQRGHMAPAKSWAIRLCLGVVLTAGFSLILTACPDPNAATATTTTIPVYAGGYYNDGSINDVPGYWKGNTFTPLALPPEERTGLSIRW